MTYRLVVQDSDHYKLTLLRTLAEELGLQYNELSKLVEEEKPDEKVPTD